MKYVLAGNHSQFMDWCRSTGTDSVKGARHIHVNALCGVHFPITDFVKVGTWRQRKDLEEIKQRLWSCIYPPSPHEPLFDGIIKTPLFDPDAEIVQPEWMVRAAAVSYYENSSSSRPL